MNLLFIHQNFPGQYRHLIRYYADMPGNKVCCITQPNDNAMKGVVKVVYQPAIPSNLNCHPFTVDFELAVRNGLGVVDACRGLVDRGFTPDIIIGHNGWGELTFIKDIFPHTPVLLYFEFYYHAQNVDVGFDPEYPADVHDAFRLRAKNAINLLSMEIADWGNAPTSWQRSVQPPELRKRISVVHEGVNTNLVAPDAEAFVQLKRDGITLTARDEVVTYVARNLEHRAGAIFVMAVRRIASRRPNTERS